MIVISTSGKKIVSRLKVNLKWVWLVESPLAMGLVTSYTFHTKNRQVSFKFSCTKCDPNFVFVCVHIVCLCVRTLCVCVCTHVHTICVFVCMHVTMCGYMCLNHMQTCVYMRACLPCGTYVCVCE